jgi:hypothetical protein
MTIVRLEGWVGWIVQPWQEVQIIALGEDEESTYLRVPSEGRTSWRTAPLSRSAWKSPDRVLQIIPRRRQPHRPAPARPDPFHDPRIFVADPRALGNQNAFLGGVTRLPIRVGDGVAPTSGRMLFNKILGTAYAADQSPLPGSGIRG